MTEKYLHFVWENKRLPIHFYDDLTKVGIELLDFGSYNAYAAGPDFFNAKLKHEGLIWNGHIELHVKSSDWYRHGHEQDGAYNNVILHVVYEDDQPVFQQDLPLLTVALKPYLEENDFKRFQLRSTVSNRIWCSSQLPEQFKSFDYQDKFSMVYNRMQRKIHRLNAFQQANRHDQIFYELLAQSLFGSSNYIPASELTIRYPIEKLMVMYADEQEFLLKVGSALDSCQDDFIRFASMPHINTLMVSGGQVAHSSWNRAALRPAAQPDQRLLAFINAVHTFDWEVLKDCRKSLKELSSNLIQWVSALNMETKSIKDSLIINCIVPFMLWIEHTRNDGKVESKRSILQLLETMPEEKNQKVLRWKKLGLNIKSAFDSQHILEQNDQFCAQKKCLSCTIGKQLLS